MNDIAFSLRFSYRMEHIIDKSVSNTFIEKHHTFHENIVTAVNGHRRAIESVSYMR